MSTHFDPLVELYGIRTAELAEHYLPLPGLPPAKYECVDGYLIMSPYKAAPNVLAAVELYVKCPVGEFISPSSRRNHRIDKPAMCAEADIPYYLLGQADPRRRRASLQLSRLVGDRYELVAEAKVGERFEIDEPFRVAFHPVDLLAL
ncbi:MAG TPA: hypothetical protein VHW44_04380 [Pseudonocardiaceae bacterium]|jgi:hypothetical protein|nr:hypothetical protein [Pseudonocardiaceae bacterium]